MSNEGESKGLMLRRQKRRHEGLLVTKNKYDELNISSTLKFGTNTDGTTRVSPSESNHENIRKNVHLEKNCLMSVYGLTQNVSENNLPSYFRSNKEQDYKAEADTNESNKTKAPVKLFRGHISVNSSWSALIMNVFPYFFHFFAKELFGVNRDFVRGVRKERRVLRVTKQFTDVDGSANRLIAAIMESPELRLLEVNGISVLSQPHFLRLAAARSSNFPLKLQVLVLRGCTKLTSRALSQLLFRLRQLRCVDLQGCFNLSDETLRPLRLLRSLKRLAIGSLPGTRGIPPYSSVGLRILLGRRTALNTGCAKEHNNVKEINHVEKDLSTSENQVVCANGSTQAQEVEQKNDEALVPPLSLLSMANCSKITDFMPLYNLRSSLEVLDLRGCRLDDTAAETISSLSKLQILILADCAVGAKTIEAITLNCLELQFLDIARIGSVSNDVFFLIGTRLRKIRRLKLSGNSALDDIQLRHILANLSELTMLDVSKCWKISNEFAGMSLVISAGTRLQRFGIYGCSVDRLNIEIGLHNAGATQTKIFTNSELSIFEMPNLYNKLKEVDLIPLSTRLIP